MDIKKTAQLIKDLVEEMNKSGAQITINSFLMLLFEEGCIDDEDTNTIHKIIEAK